MSVGHPAVRSPSLSRSSFLFTSESVSEGHPDKVADRISDTVVDLFLSKDPYARVACETLTTTNLVVLAGEIRGEGIMGTDGQWAPGVPAEIEAAVRAAVRDIGYAQTGFHWQTFEFINRLHGQSTNIAVGVDAAGNKDEGAGDQGIMFGYASNETPELMPATLQYSHNILKRLAEVRHGGEMRLEPDAKSQVTIQYEDGVPVRATSIVLSTQHAKGLSQAEVAAIVKPHILDVLPAGFTDENTVWHINPTGIFEIGGPDGDSGLTGRKIIVAAGLADRCTIQISYAIGVAKPQSIHVDLHGTGKGAVTEAVLEANILGLIGGATPRAIREHLGLNKPIYARTAAYGHFGRAPDADGGFSWEKTDLVDQLKALV
jgi:S-adenosylmethionine synthetase